MHQGILFYHLLCTSPLGLVHFLHLQVHFLIQHVLSVDMGGESTDVPHARSGGGVAVLLEGCLAGGHDSQPQQSSRDHALPHAPLSQGPVSR